MDVKDLDIVLSALDDMEKRTSEMFTDIVKTIGEGVYTDKEVDLILQKLVDDGYAIKKFADTTRDGVKIKSTLRLFHITYNGHIFLKEGGYSAIINDKILKSKNLKKENTLLYVANIAVVIGGLYYLFSILKEFASPFFHHLIYH